MECTRNMNPTLRMAAILLSMLSLSIGAARAAEKPLMARWKDVVKNLADYPTDKRGYMIARGVPFVKGHRHYSQLLMLYPLYLVNREHEGAEELMLTTVRHWHSMGGRQGYSLDLKKGEEAFLWSGESMPSLTVSPVVATQEKRYSFGLN